MYGYDWNSAFSELGSGINQYASNLDNVFTTVSFKIVALLIFAVSILICAFGYKIQRIFIGISTAIFFGVASFLLAHSISDHNTSISLLTALAFAVVGGFLGFKLYKAMAALSVGLTGFTFGYGFVEMLSGGKDSGNIPAIIVGLLIGFIFGFVMFKIFKPIIIIFTALQGGFIAAFSLVSLFMYKGFIEFFYKISGVSGLFGGGDDSSRYWMPLGVLFVVLGCIFQFKTAERKVSDFIAELKLKAGGLQPGTQTMPAIPDNKILNIFFGTITFPEQKNIVLYFSGGAALALISIFMGASASGFILRLAVAGILALLVLIYKNTIFQYQNTVIHVLFAIVALMSAWGLISMLASGGAFYALLFNGGTGLFAVSLWLTVARRDTRPILYTIGSALLALDILIYIFKGSVLLFPVAMVVAMLPFVMPYITPFIKEFASKTENPTTPDIESSDSEEELSEMISDDQQNIQ